MDNTQLILAMMQRDIIREGTLLYGKTIAYSLGQRPSMIPLELFMERYQDGIFYCRNRLGQKYKMQIVDVEEIDGMTPQRLAAVFDIRPNEITKPRKKRGRKPKINMLEEQYGKTQPTTDNNHTKQVA